MPRLNRGASADVRTASARHRLVASLGSGNLPRQDDTAQDGARQDDTAQDVATQDGATQDSAARNRISLLPLGDAFALNSVVTRTGGQPVGGSDGGETGRGEGIRVRWRTRTRVVVLASVPVALILTWCLWQALSGQATAVPLDLTHPNAHASGAASVEQRGADGRTPASAGPEAGEAPKVVVHVAGAVGKPGIVALREGSRVFEAIAAAGGAAPTADLDQLNLAGVVHDGERLQVPQRGDASAAGGGAGLSAAPGGGVGGKVNINRASAEELGTLPRVGPVLAGRIVAWRTEHGPFGTVEELDAVDGVGPKLLETLLPLVTV